MAGLAPYLQLLTLLGVQVNWGTANVSWNNTSATSPNFTIAHGLGRTPVFAIAASRTGSGISYTTNSWDATNITFIGYYGPGVGLNQSVSFAWIAIG